MNEEQRRRRGIYLLPNLFTTAALFSGFYAIVAGMAGRFEPAATAIFIAMILDGLDGRVARLTNTQSDFGVQYDSLSDMVAFGIAPSLVVYLWSLSSLGKLGWLAAFFYAAAAALRLARFNAQVKVVDKRYFQGLPSPTAAAVIAGLIWVGVDFEIDGQRVAWLACLLTVLVAALMVSNVRYKSFKDLDLKGRVPFVAILAIVLVFVFISIHPPNTLFGLAMAYTLSGPLMTLVGLRNRRASRQAPDGRGEERKDQKDD